jgi:hypothetical protein
MKNAEVARYFLGRRSQKNYSPVLQSVTQLHKDPKFRQTLHEWYPQAGNGGIHTTIDNTTIYFLSHQFYVLKNRVEQSNLPMEYAFV